jgi:hypothetical protein
VVVEQRLGGVKPKVITKNGKRVGLSKTEAIWVCYHGRFKVLAVGARLNL